MKLTRAQEEMLIRIGLDTLLKNGAAPVQTVYRTLAHVTVPAEKKRGRPKGAKKIVKPGQKSRKLWTPEHREKFYATLAKKRQEQLATPPQATETVDTSTE